MEIHENDIRKQPKPDVLCTPIGVQHSAAVCLMMVWMNDGLSFKMHIKINKEIKIKRHNAHCESSAMISKTGVLLMRFSRASKDAWGLSAPCSPYWEYNLIFYLYMSTCLGVLVLDERWKVSVVFTLFSRITATRWSSTSTGRHDLPKEFTVNLPAFELIQRPAHPRRCFQCLWLVKPGVLHCFGNDIDITRHQCVKNGAVRIINEAN